MEKISFAEQLRIMTTDRRTALFEEFINQVIKAVKSNAENRAIQGYSCLEYQSGPIPEPLFSLKQYNKKELLSDYKKIIYEKLKDCNFTDLLVESSFPNSWNHGYYLHIKCRW